jgi:PAS domain S-box-containing protein
MDSARKQKGNAKWLVESGPKELELLLRAVLYQSSEPILITDNDRHCLDASVGAGKLLRSSRDQILTRRIDDFVAPSFRPRMEQLWRAFLENGEQDGKLPLAVSRGAEREVGYVASGSILPVRHLFVLHDSAKHKESKDPAAVSVRVPSWVKDSALLLLDSAGCVATWYAGAERIYGYKREEAIGQNLSFLYPSENGQGAELRGELTRAASGGRFGSEVWHQRKDGSRFWANVLTVALHDSQGELQGFARVVRDFSDRHESDRKLAHGGEHARKRSPKRQPSVVGIVSGEFDRVTDASDAFLAMVGYEHHDLVAGKIYWPDLTPPEYGLMEERAHEEGLIYGACAPFEKEYIHKNGTRVRVLVTGAVLSLSPFRWTVFVQDLREHEAEKVERETPGAHTIEGIVGDSAALRRVLGQVEMVAPTDATVLILGETGTGKELVARAIHNLSERSKSAFVTLNCAAIPTGLLESELFGYERGAFTGALSRKIGRFEMAHQGTLFLDEVGDIPLDLQPKLLRALQEKEFERLGGTRTIPIDVRLLAATNRNLTQMMGDNLFRSDLYYRLKVFPITVPPLRDHPEDIPMLARHFTQKYAGQMKRNIDTIPSDTMRALVSWSWPGNVRELENFIERAVILSRGPDLRAPLAEIRAGAAEPVNSNTLEQVEREHIIHVLRQTDGVVSTAATRLGLPRTTLNAMMRKLGISRKDL